MRGVRGLSSGALLNRVSVGVGLDRLGLGTSKKFQSGGIKANNKSRRAYETVTVHKVDYGLDDTRAYTIYMDNKVLVTPKSNFVILPTRLLATAVAAEWERQGSLLKPTSMPLFGLTSSAIDGFSEPDIREANKAILYNYIATDTACYRSPSLKRLADRQDRVLNPLIEWAEKEFGAKLNTTYSFEPVEQPAETIQIMKDQLETMDCWDLAVFDSLTKVTKSYLIALATVKGHLNAQQAFIHSRVEEELQIQTWGEVEGGHDIDSSYTKVKVFAASVFQRLVNNSQ